MLRRRVLLTSACACLLGIPLASLGQLPRKSNALRLGADPVAVPLARALLRGFGRDTGLVAQLEVVPSTALLNALDAGELDAAITAAAEAEAKMEQQGLVHDRHQLAVSDLLLAGPTAGAIARGRDVIAALRTAAEKAAPFVGRRDGSGLHLAELGLWRAAGVSPAKPWYLDADSAGDVIAQARRERACALIDRAGWQAAGGARKDFGVLVEGDPKLALPLHVMRPFRTSHPSAKLFVAWAVGRQGRRVTAAQGGVRAAR
jgi:tungstate transport system substrate-binding protein